MASVSLSDAALIRRLLGLAWRYRWGCFRIVALQVVVLLLGVVVIALTGVAIDELRAVVDPTAHGDHRFFGFTPPVGWAPMTIVSILAGLIIVVAIARAFFDFLFRDVVNQLVQVEFVINLRELVFNKLQRLSFRFFDANASASLINRVIGDVQSVRLFVDQVLIQSAVLVLSLGAYLTYMFALHVPLTLACLATTPFLAVAAVRFSREIQPEYQEARRLNDEMVQCIVDDVKGIPVVQAFNREQDEIERFKIAKERVYLKKLGVFRRIARFMPTVNFLSQFNRVILLAYGGYLVIEGRLSLGTGFIAFATILNNFAGQVTSIAIITNSLQESLTGARRVFEILDMPIDVVDRPDAREVGRLSGEVEFQNVSVRDGGRTILDGVSFHVKPGERVGIFGSVGSGKSTLVSLIPRFYDPSEGVVLVDGNDVRDLKMDGLRGNVGVVFQESFLFNHTVAENIAFGFPDATRGQVMEAAKVAQIHDFIVSLPDGYDTVLVEGIGLSGGQRQKIAIARAILNEPPILLLDAPSSALDPVSEYELLDAMEAVMQGRTTFLITHRFSQLSETDRVLVLEEGRLVQSGTHAELMAQPGLYAESFRGWCAANGEGREG